MQGISRSDSNASKNTKEDPTKDLSPVEKLLYNAGPIRPDGSDKFFGLENVRTCSWEVQFNFPQDANHSLHASLETLGKPTAREPATTSSVC